MRSSPSPSLTCPPGPTARPRNHSRRASDSSQFSSPTQDSISRPKIIRRYNSHTSSASIAYPHSRPADFHNGELVASEPAPGAHKDVYTSSSSSNKYCIDQFRNNTDGPIRQNLPPVDRVNGSGAHLNHPSHASIPQSNQQPKRKQLRHPLSTDVMKPLSHNPNPSVSQLGFLPSSSTSPLPDDSIYPTPNLYEITLTLNAHPGLEAWWTNVVSVLNANYGVERLTLSIPGDLTDPENGLWLQKASYHSYRNHLATHSLQSAASRINSDSCPEDEEESSDEMATPQTSNLEVFTDPRSLETEPEPLISETGVARLFGRTKPVWLTREYVDDPMATPPLQTTTKHQDLVQSANSKEPVSLAAGPSWPTPPQQFDEYEQAIPSPWSQSPAPSPAPLLRPEINPFFIGPEVNEDAFAASPPPHDYSKNEPLQAIGIDRAKTVVHIPLVHATSSKQRASDPLRFPVAIISFLAPIIPYPENLRASLGLLLPHLTTSFCLAQQYTELETRLSDIYSERYGHVLGLGGTFSNPQSELELVAGLSPHVSTVLGDGEASDRLISPLSELSSNHRTTTQAVSTHNTSVPSDTFQSPSPMSRFGTGAGDSYFKYKNLSRQNSGIRRAFSSVPTTPVSQESIDYMDGLVMKCLDTTRNYKMPNTTPIPQAAFRHPSSISPTTPRRQDTTSRPFPDAAAQLMLNSVPLHLFLAKPDVGELIWTNTKFDAYRRSTPREHSIQSVWGNVHPNDRDHLIEEWSRALQTGSQFTQRLRMKRSDDESEHRWFIFRANPLISRAGEVLYWIGSFLDIHEQHISEMKVAEEREKFATEAKYRALSNSIPQVVFEAAESRGLLSVNVQWELYTGQSAEEAQNLGFAKHIHREDLDKCGIFSPPQVLPDSAEMPDFSRIVLNGLSDELRKNAELFKRESKAVSSKQSNDLPGEEMQNEAPFRPFADGITPALQKLVQRGVVTVQRDENGRDSYTTEIRFRSRKGEFRWHLVRLVKVDSPELGNKEPSWYGTCTDINDRKILERELNMALEKLNHEMESKMRFFSDMSHEIRTPLAGIIGSVPFIWDTELNLEQRKMLATMHNSSSNLRELVDNILDVSKVEAGKMNIVMQCFHVRSVIEDVIDTICSRAISKGLEVNYIFDPKVPSMILADRFRIRQILTNLMGNAVKFTSKGEICTICTVDTQTEADLQPHEFLLKFDVIDTGKGFSAKDSKLLMQRFSQADNNGSHQHEGSGLGLFLSKQLVEMHGGNITASAIEGQGARFSFYIKVENAPAPKPQAVKVKEDEREDQELSSGNEDEEDNIKDEPESPLGDIELINDATVAGLDLINDLGDECAKSDETPKPIRVYDFYDALILCPLGYAREAMKQHLEQIIPLNIPATISTMGSLKEWKQLLKKGACDNLTHLILCLPNFDDLMKAMEFVLQLRGKCSPTLVVITHSILKRKLANTQQKFEEAGKRLVFVSKPVRPSSFSPIFDPRCERELSKDRNLAMLQEINNRFKNLSKHAREILGNKGHRVLLVEDDETNRAVMLRYLDKINLTCELAENGQECVDMVLSKVPGYYSLIICDIQMPFKNGYETCKEIRAWEQENHFPMVPIIALSASAMSDQIEQAFKMGFNAYLTKPMQHNDIAWALIEQLDSTSPHVDHRINSF
ncbi:hypothetical protein FQN57_006207 [Myotisia sp. PD_48]|nr:hypothetical protein FQN57_006207 [Myotisia sp. PD_48]